MGFGGAALVVAAARWIGGWLYLAAPLRTRGAIVLTSIVGLLSVVAGDVPGFAASLGTFALLRRPAAREFYRQSIR